MNTLIISITLIVVYTVLLLAYFKIANKYGILDRPNSRSSHSYHTIRGAGLIFLIGIIFGMVWSKELFPIYFTIGLVSLSIVSFIDDVKGLSSTIRFIVHLLAGVLLAIQLWPISQSVVLSVILVVAVAIFVNGFNFMDGINGITGIYSIVLLVSVFLTNYLVVDFIDSNLLLAVFLFIAVFGFFNFRKRAVCFAGDVGSVPIAFFIVFVLAQLIIFTGGFYYILFISVYLIDFGLTLLHRLLLGEKISQPHRKHLYQLLVNEKGYQHITVSASYGLIQLFVNTILILVVLNTHNPVIIYGFTLVMLVLMASFYLTLRNRYFRLHQLVKK